MWRQFTTSLRHIRTCNGHENRCEVFTFFYCSSRFLPINRFRKEMSDSNENRCPTKKWIYNCMTAIRRWNNYFYLPAIDYSNDNINVICLLDFRVYFSEACGSNLQNTRQQRESFVGLIYYLFLIHRFCILETFFLNGNYFIIFFILL